MKRRRKKNLPKANNHSFLQVCKPVKSGFEEALKDFSKKIFSISFELILAVTVSFFYHFFK
ncbi:hypothetical protein [Clostridium sp.]|uniref:hypothetical protein n=1 Tax=Clostridium sp. TaxID=1506 RepID=UPI001A48B5DB|nr:hypothetical protein [Clostridium sp.]MBK5234900.1 hypothetical protein [Clostridium sp.]